MWSKFTEPLLARELLAGARRPSKAVISYSGLKEMALITIAGLFLAVAAERLWPSANDAALYNRVSGGFWYALIAWVQLIWALYRCGYGAAASTSADVRNESYRALAASPFGVGRCVLAKVLGNALPIWLELAAAAVPTFVAFCLLGHVWGGSDMGAGLLGLGLAFQLLSSWLGCALGVFLGAFCDTGGLKAPRIYRQIVVGLAMTGAAVCYSNFCGALASVVLVLCFLLLWLPELSPGNGYFAGSAAIMFMVALPILMFMHTAPITERLQMLNPFITVWRCQAVEWQRSSMQYSAICSEYRTARFVESFLDSQHMLNSPRGAIRERQVAEFARRINACWRTVVLNERLSVGEREQLANIVLQLNRDYFRWRQRDLALVGLVYALLSLLAMGSAYMRLRST